MTSGARTAITLTVLVVALGIAAVWGWGAAMKPLPQKVDSPICVDTAVAAGAAIYPQQVTVSVYNGGQRDGLAGRTMQLLLDRGFSEGSTGNLRSAKVRSVAIWTTDPDSPAVELLASHLGDDVDIERRDGIGAGVTVVVGDDFATPDKGRRAVRATEDTEICSPPVA